jgi:hydrogenase nickel incorporation protein HypA/HybF
MHELAVCQALVRQVAQLAAERAGAPVREIVVDIGPLSGVEPELLARAFPLASTGSAAEGARLEVRTPPIVVRCRECGHEGPATVNRLLCEACGDWRVGVTQGEDLLLRSVVFSEAAPADRRTPGPPHAPSNPENDHV